MKNLKLLHDYFEPLANLQAEQLAILNTWIPPTIVLLGSKNVGKSTLVERLLMINLFSKEKEFASRIPIRICMRTNIDEKTIIRIMKLEGFNQKETILSTSQFDISQALVQIIDETIDQLLKEELTQKKNRLDRLIEVELRRVNFPNLDILDLPGIFLNARPNDDSHASKEIYDLYLHTLKRLKDRGIFLAIKEAGEDHQQSMVIKLVNEVPEIKNLCLGVLTKCDLISHQLLIDRLIKLKELNLGYGHFAMINEFVFSNWQAIENYEKEYFQNIILPKDLSLDQIGGEMLLECLNGVYHQYLKKNWVDLVLEHLTKKFQMIEADIQSIGPVFKENEDAKFDQLITITLNLIRQKSIHFIVFIAFQKINNQKELIKSLFLANHFKEEQDCFWIESLNSFNFLSQKNNLRQQIKKMLKETINLLFEDYFQKIKQLLEDDVFGKTVISPLCIGRFPKLIQCILSKITMATSKESILERFEESIDQWFVNELEYEQQRLKIRDLKALFDQVINDFILNLQAYHWDFDWQSFLFHQSELWEDSSIEGRNQLKKHQDEIIFAIQKITNRFGIDLSIYQSKMIEGTVQIGVNDILYQNCRRHTIQNIDFYMVKCQSGDFWMGDSSHLEGRHWQNVMPKHKVKISKHFWIGETQVTQELWQVVMGWEDQFFKENTQHPIERVTWYDCLFFCNKLSELEGLMPCFRLSKIEKFGKHIIKANVEWNREANGYRLPTEAEWEYAAKAGRVFDYSGSKQIDEVAWFDQNSRGKTNEVKMKNPNDWGLYDMSGNVWEWCMDEWRSTIEDREHLIENPVIWNNTHCSRSLRGGSYHSQAIYCSITVRPCDAPDGLGSGQGFRLLRNE